MRLFYIGFLLVGIFIFAACAPRITAGYTNAYKRYSDKIEKGFIEHPTREDTYFCKFEVTNWEYNLFLDSIKTSSPILWEKCHYQAELWEKNNYFPNNPYPRTYHTSPWFQDYPIVNITHFGAVEYCNWLSEYYNKQKFRKHDRVLFRLPKKDEYQFLFSIIEVDIIPKDTTNQNSYLFNLAYNKRFAIDGSQYTTKVFEYIQTDAGYCSIIGNASEMTAKGEQTGGSWYSNPDEAELFTAIDGPSPELGFRIVMEVLER